MQELYSMNLNVESRRCVVVGGGHVALRKVEGLLYAGADVFVIGPHVCDEIRILPVHLCVRPFDEADLRGAALALAATDDPAVNLRVAATANELGIPVNVVDQPALCSFFLPAVVRRGGLVISISTSGSSPALARRLRERLEQEFGPEYEPYVKWLDDLRSEIMGRVRSPEERRQILQEIAGEKVEHILRTQGFDSARRHVEKLIEECTGG